MPWPDDRKNNTRERILDSAITLFANKGYDNVSLGEVMSNAGLTHGGFYAHFASKQALYAEAVTAAASRSALARLKAAGGEKADVQQLLHGYLSSGHIDGEQPPCPLAFLATDVANREQDVRSAYTRVFRRLAALIERELPQHGAPRRERALALAALMVGGVAVGRALDDPRLTDALLAACRRLGEDLLQGGD